MEMASKGQLVRFDEMLSPCRIMEGFSVFLHGGLANIYVAQATAEHRSFVSWG